MHSALQILSAFAVFGLSVFAYAKASEDDRPSSTIPSQTGIVEEENDQIEELTVVGSRLDTDLIGLQSIDLSDQTSQTLTAAMQSLTGMAVSQSGNVGSLTQLRVRGAEADHLKVLVDGVPLGNPSTVNLNLSAIAPTGISRVDALNGPRSAIWGSDALAGVISLSTNQTPTNRIYVDRGSNQAWYWGTSLGTKIVDAPVAAPL